MNPPVCHHCGAPLEVSEPVPRDAECPACGGDVRCCLNCRHHDPRMHNQCRETEADPVEDRRRRNFCEFFSISREPLQAASRSRADDARARLEALFRKPKGPDATS